MSQIFQGEKLETIIIFLINSDGDDGGEISERYILKHFQGPMLRTVSFYDINRIS